MAVQTQDKPKTKGVLTVVIQGTGQDLSHAASREADKLRANGMLVTRTSDIYFDKGGNHAVDIEWKIDPEWDAPEHPAATFQGHIARISTEHPESAGKELVNKQTSMTEEKAAEQENDRIVAETKATSSREATKTTGKKAGTKMVARTASKPNPKNGTLPKNMKKAGQKTH